MKDKQIKTRKKKKTMNKNENGIILVGKHTSSFWRKE
jgi:hypothetical protein